jgi:hypothetical protein
MRSTAAGRCSLSRLWMKRSTGQAILIVTVAFAVGVGGASMVQAFQGGGGSGDSQHRPAVSDEHTTSTQAAQTEPAATSTTVPAATQSARLVPPILKPGYAASFDALARTLSGPVGLAVAPLGAGSTIVLGDDAAQDAWSTMKVGVLSALLRREGTLTASQQILATEAITQSDNVAVNELFAELEAQTGGLDQASLAIQALLRQSGDDTTQVNTVEPGEGFSTFGHTLWSPSESVKFYRALFLGCLLPRATTNYVLNLMEHVIPSESWGLGSAGFVPPLRTAFKGGWGPESYGYLVRQSGIVAYINGSGSSGAVVSMFSDAPDFNTGTEVLTAIAQWLRQNLNLVVRPGLACGT